MTGWLTGGYGYGAYAAKRLTLGAIELGESALELNRDKSTVSLKVAYRRLPWDDHYVSRFWRWQAQRPHEYFTNLFGKRIASTLAPVLRGGDGSVLDYGCGLGFLPRYLAALGFQVWATDFSPESVGVTNQLNHGVQGFQGAAVVNEVRKQGKRFSRVISVEVIEHLDDRHIGIFFEAVANLLAPGGMLIITTPNEEDLEKAEIYCPSCDHVFHRYQHVRSFSEATLAALVVANGFMPVNTFATDFSRRSWWHPKQVVRDLVAFGLGQPRSRPHLVCIATKLT